MARNGARMPMDHRQVAHEFVEKYYKLLQQTPEQLYKFYKAHSVFTFSRDSDGVQSNANGQEQIHNGIMLALQPLLGHITMVSRSQVDSQASRKGGLLVLVTGQLVTYDGYCQHFTQSFLLDQQVMPTPGYFVLCDFLRYVEATPVQQCPAPGAQSLQGGVPVMTAEAMMCQEQCMAPSLGAMQMMSPHDVGGAGQAQPWMQPRMHHSMVQQVHHAPVPVPRPMHQEAAPAPAPAPSRSVSGASRVTNAPFVPRQPAVLVDAAVVEEPPRLPDTALIEDLPKSSDLAVPAVAEVPKGDDAGENGGRDEAEAEVELDMEEYEEDEGLGEDMIPQLEEMEARDDGNDSGSSPTASVNVAADAKDDGAAATDRPPTDEDAGGGGPLGDDEFQYFDDQPRSWASMAGRLKEGGGGLTQSKVTGYGAPAGAPGSKMAGASPTTASSGSNGAVRGQDRATDRGAAAEKSSGGATATSSYEVWLWVSRLPTDTKIDGQEVLDCINSYLGEVGRALDIERRDQTQEWANLVVSSQEAADLILHISRDRKLLLRGKSIKADVHKQAFASGRRGGSRGGRGSSEGGSKGQGRGRGAALEGGDDERSGEGRGAGRARRRPGKGGKGEGHGGDAPGRWATSS